MSKIKLTKKHHLLWDEATKEILVDFETKNPRTVTYCDRDGVAGAEFDTEAAKEKKIKDDGLVKQQTSVSN